MGLKPATESAYRLLHEGAITLAQAEANGIKIDVAYLNRAIDETQAKIADEERELRNDRDVYPEWRKRFGDRLNLGSDEQFGTVVFDCLGFKRKPSDREEREKNDEAAFEHVTLPFKDRYFRWKRLYRVQTTYLIGGLRNNLDSNGFIHPFFNLHFVLTFRSSSDSPNFQNIPIRREEIASIIRRCFIPRSERYLFGETDYSGIEVRIAACYCLDPILIDEIQTGFDMHKEMAIKVYKLLKDEWNKDSRYCAKNMFVFPQFYGSYWRDCARHLWEACEKLHLKTKSGKPLREHLAERGLRELGAAGRNDRPTAGTYEDHVCQIEKWFWDKYRVYAGWKQKWEKDYYRNGGYRLLTGFNVEGIYRRNEIINGAVQGSAFHCLLFTLIEFQKWLNRYQMRTKIMGQIHDSIVIDFHEDEVEDCLNYIRWIVRTKLPKTWKWIIVPMDIETEIAPNGLSWFEKKKVDPPSPPNDDAVLGWDRHAKEGKGAWQWQ